jgi:hypothetical protein
MNTHELMALLIICILGVFPATADAGVIVVNPFGGDFPDLQSAVQAAAPGDLLLVGPGADPGASVNGKPLTIVAYGAASIFSLHIQGLDAGETVVVRGFQLGGTSAFPWGDVGVSGNEGAVWFEDCGLLGGPGGFPGPMVIGSASVTFVRCSIQGGDGINCANGGPAMQVISSSVALYGCSTTGGDGGIGNSCGSAVNGGAGLELIDSQVLISGGSILGGKKGLLGVGGNGVIAHGSSLVQHLGALVLGSGGSAGFVAPPGTVQALPGTPRSLQSLPKALLPEQQAGILKLKGLQGDVVFLFASLGSMSLPKPGLSGWFVLDPASLAGPGFLGAITAAGGALDIDFVAPSLPPALEEVTLLLQAAFINGGTLALSDGTALSIVDAAF